MNQLKNPRSIYNQKLNQRSGSVRDLNKSGQLSKQGTVLNLDGTSKASPGA